MKCGEAKTACVSVDTPRSPLWVLLLSIGLRRPLG